MDTISTDKVVLQNSVAPSAAPARGAGLAAAVAIAHHMGEPNVPRLELTTGGLGDWVVVG
jgi:hypothetical protein